MILWESLAAAAVLEGINELRKEAERSRTAAYDLRQNCFEGGEKTKLYLVRHVKESDSAWQERNRCFKDCGLANRIASLYIGSLAGHEITRTIEGASDEQNTLLKRMLEVTRIDSKQRMIAQDQVVAGDAFSLVAYSDRLGTLHIHTPAPGEVYVESDPDDPFCERTVVERRVDPNAAGKFIYWIWTVEAKNLIDQDGRELDQGYGKSGWQTNPYGVIPYTHWRGLPLNESYWGRSPIAAVCELHKFCNNLHTQLDKIILYQAFAIPVFKGNFDPKLVVGEGNALVLPNPDDDFNYVTSDADIEAVRKAYEFARIEAFEVAGIPQSIHSGGKVASGYALEVECVPMSITIGDLAIEAKAAEIETMKKFCLIGAKHGLELPENPEISVDMNIQIFPRDKAADRLADGLDLEAGRMTLEDYIKRNRPDVKDVPAYVAELERGKQERRSTGFELPARANGFEEPKQ